MSSLLPAVLFSIASGSWFFFETYAQARFDAGNLPNYDWIIDSISDLGVNYRQVHPLKHFNAHSYAHGAINFGILLAGLCFGLGQLEMLWSTRRSATRETARARLFRFLLTGMYAGGMVLFSQVHGGPREKFWGTIGWHWIGFGMAALGGNLNAILTAIVPTAGLHERLLPYRAVSAVLGVLGLFGYWRFNTLGEWDFETHIGLWQRVTVYPVLAWEAVTAAAIWYGVFGAAKGKGKGKKA